MAECGFPNLISDEADNSSTGDVDCGGVKPGGPTDEGDQPRFRMAFCLQYDEHMTLYAVLSVGFSVYQGIET